MKRTRWAAFALLAASALGGASSAAFASGGPTGGGGGGGGGGGVAPPTSSAPVADCATLVGFKAVAGRRPGGADAGAVWVSAGIKSCGTATESYTLHIDETNLTSGQLEWSWRTSAYLSPGSTYNPPTIDNDWVFNSTSYRVDVTITTADGRVMDSASATVTTPVSRLAPTPAPAPA